MLNPDNAPDSCFIEVMLFPRKSNSKIKVLSSEATAGIGGLLMDRVVGCIAFT